MIADDNGALGLGGVIGGEPIGLHREHDQRLRRGGAVRSDPHRDDRPAPQIISDARYRFERGVDPAAVAEGMEVATRLILELCGGEAERAGRRRRSRPSGSAATRCGPSASRRWAASTCRSTRATRILDRARLRGRARQDGNLAVAPPSWRGDVAGRGRPRRGSHAHPRLRQHPAVPLPRETATADRRTDRRRSAARATARRALAGCGLTEAVTFSFLPARMRRCSAAQQDAAARQPDQRRSRRDAAVAAAEPAARGAAQRRPRARRCRRCSRSARTTATTRRTGSARSPRACASARRGPRHWGAKPRAGRRVRRQGRRAGRCSPRSARRSRTSRSRPRRRAGTTPAAPAP